jgi:hypothetical protein
MPRKRRIFFKRRQKEKLKKMNQQNLDKIIDINKPVMWKIDSEQEMLEIFRNSRKTDKTLIFDLNGTLIPYSTSVRSHKKIIFRPFYEELISQTKIFCDLYLFSKAKILRIQNIFNKFMVDDFAGIFNIRHLSSKRKSLRPLMSECCNVLIIDDTEEAIHSDSMPNLIKIKRWHGEKEDKELLRILKVIKNRWNIID